MKIGAQFYTIRDFCKNLNDFSESLAKIADIGYEYVQISGTCSFDAKWLKLQLDKNGLKCVLTHTPSNRLLEDIDNVLEEHSIIGCNNIGLGFFSFDEEQKDHAYGNFIDTYMPTADRISSSGKYFMFHNHAKEFQKINGKPIIEMLSDDFGKDKLGFTLDTYWVQVGGGDPAYWIEKLAGRVPCIHLKDYAYGQKMAVLGEGNLNFDRIFNAAEKAGTEYMLVEQDECYGEDPFDCLKRSYEYLKSRGF